MTFLAFPPGFATSGAVARVYPTILSPGAGWVTTATTISAPSSSGAYGTASFGKSSGKWYWEVTGTSGVNSTDQYMGIGNSTTPSSFGNPTSTGSWVTHSAGDYRLNGSVTGSCPNWQFNGCVLGFYLDATNGTLGFIINGADQGLVVTGLPAATYSPRFGCEGSAVFTVNWGASAFSNTVPSGYNAGFYN